MFYQLFKRSFIKLSMSTITFQNKTASSWCVSRPLSICRKPYLHIPLLLLQWIKCNTNDCEEFTFKKSWTISQLSAEIFLRELYHFLLLVLEIGIHKLAHSFSLFFYYSSLSILNMCKSLLKFILHHSTSATISYISFLYFFLESVFYTSVSHLFFNPIVISMVPLKLMERNKEPFILLVWTLHGSWTVVHYLIIKTILFFFLPLGQFCLLVFLLTSLNIISQSSCGNSFSIGLP